MFWQVTYFRRTSLKSMGAHSVEELAPTSILIAVVGLIVSMAWNGFANTLFDHISEKLKSPDGYGELALRLTYAVVLTLVAVHLVRGALTRQKSRQKVQQK